MSIERNCYLIFFFLAVLSLIFQLEIYQVTFLIWSHLRWGAPIRSPREAEIYTTFLSKPLILGFDPQHYLLWSHNKKKTKMQNRTWLFEKKKSTQHSSMIDNFCSLLHQNYPQCSIFIPIFLLLWLYPFFNHRKTLKTKSYERARSFSAQILVLGGPGLF